MLIHILLLLVMTHTSLFLGAKIHAACHRRSKFASGKCIVSNVMSLIDFNSNFNKPLKRDPS